MANVRYTTEVKDVNSVTWKIEIFDNEFSGTQQGIKCSYPILSYPETEITDVILGSMLTVPIIVNNTSLKSFIVELTTCNDTRFTVALYKNNVLNWSGVYSPDIVSYEDMNLPFNFSIKFTDGLARLKNVDYNIIGDYMTMKDIIFNCLSNLPYALINHTCKVAVNVKHINQQGGRTLERARVNDSCFYKKENDVLEPRSVYEVLKNVLTMYDARIMQGNGAFYIISTNYESLYRSLEFFNYNSSGAYVGFSQGDLDAIGVQKLNGNYSLDSNNRKFIYNYKYEPISESGRYLDKTYALGDGDVSLGTQSTGTKFRFLGDFHIDMELYTQEIEPYVAVFKLKINVDTYYITRGAIEYSWESSADEIELKLWMNKSQNLERHIDYSYSFVTPKSLTGGTGIFSCEFSHIEDTNGVLQVNGTDYFNLHKSVSNFLLFTTLDEEDETLEGKFVFINQNSSSGDFDIGETFFGTVPDRLNGVQYFDGLEWYVDTESNGWGTDYIQHRYRMGEVIAYIKRELFSTPIKSWSGIIKGDAEVYNLFEIENGAKYQVSGFKKNLKRAEMEGTFVKI